MSSKSIRQAIVILASTHGALKTISEQCAVGPEIAQEIKTALGLAHHAICHYPCSQGKDDALLLAKDGQWTVERMLNWKKEIEQVPKEWEYFVLVSVAYQAIADLVGKLKDRRKLALVEPLLGPIGRISDFSDPAGINYDAFECADATMRKLYEQIEFRA